MAIMKVNDAEFYYELHGSGQAMVLISGYTCDHQVWVPVLDVLKNNFQVLIFDNRGSGRTKDDGKDITPDLMAQDVIDLCDALNIKNPHIIGHSMGGAIAQTIAINYPNKINKLGILNSSSKWNMAMRTALRSLILMREQHVNFDIIFNATISWGFGEEFLQNNEYIDMFKQIILNNPYMQTLEDQKRQFKVLEKFDNRKSLNKIKAETLVLYSIQDLLTLPHESVYISDQIPNSKLVKFTCGHVVMTEEPLTLSKELIDFFAN